MLTVWTSNDTNTVYTATGARGKYTITFIKFTDSGQQVWALQSARQTDAMRTYFSTLAGAKRRANDDDQPIR